MRVLIVRAPAGGPVRVHGAGISGQATWRGDSQPEEGDSAEVELNVPFEVNWHDILVDATLRATELHESAALLITGVVADVDQHGVLTLDTGSGVVLVDTSGSPPIGIVGRPVQLKVNDAELFPVDL